MEKEGRTREMYISETLDYSYKKVGLFDEIDLILKQILPEEKYRDACLRWRGLCLTGVTKEQKFVLNVPECVVMSSSAAVFSSASSILFWYLSNSGLSLLMSALSRNQSISSYVNQSENAWSRSDSV